MDIQKVFGYGSGFKKSISARPITSLGHQEGWRVFQEGLKYF